MTIIIVYKIHFSSSQIRYSDSDWEDKISENEDQIFLWFFKSMSMKISLKTNTLQTRNEYFQIHSTLKYYKNENLFRNCYRWSMIEKNIQLKSNFFRWLYPNCIQIIVSDLHWSLAIDETKQLQRKGQTIFSLYLENLKLYMRKLKK